MSLKHTPGPWTWAVNETCKTISLMGWKDGSRHHVMCFKRYGMQSAQPVFEEDGLMHNSTKYFSVIKGQEHNRSWNKTIYGNANARLIAAAPEMLEIIISDLRMNLKFMSFGDITFMRQETNSEFNKKIDIVEKATDMTIEEVLNVTD